MSRVAERFLKYVSFDTQSEDDKEVIPSTEKQRALAAFLYEELKEIGASNVRLTEQAYVYATIPANTKNTALSLGFIAHMDTAPAMSGKEIKPRIVENYDGGDIVLNQEKEIVMEAAEFPYLETCRGKALIVTDGTTLLGADDKAGIAEIMEMAAYFIGHPEVPHGTIQIAFTPDEEVGRGADDFDVTGFQADVAYTVDGCAMGELEYENFNGASGKVSIQGMGIHPGAAKGKMKNAVLLGMEFQNLLPVFENPMYTEKYEGFFHLDNFSGNVESAFMDYIIRDHDREKLEQKKKLFLDAVAFMNQKYGVGTLRAEVKDTYYNMKEMIEPHKYLIDIAAEAMSSLGMKPEVIPIRGGTDGAKLSYMGLPCPNLCTGGYNCHGKYEFVPIQDMETVTELLIDIVKRFEGRGN